MNINTLSLREKIGQMIVVRSSGYLFDHQIRYPQWEATSEQLKTWLTELNLGGVILLGGSAAELALRTQQLQQWAKIPLLIAADIEEGVGQRFTGATWFPPPMSLGKIAEINLDKAVNHAFQMGKITAQEALAMGINWILAPIVDVNNNPDNPVINIRSFGDRPEIVSPLATAFIKGANSYPVLTTAKHFPGHGDTTTDSHLDLPKIIHCEKRLEEIELPPFEAAIQAEVDTIMTAHLLIQEWDRHNPATISYAILTGQLREKLGFQGLIVTDALIMGGITKYASESEIYVKAIAAGADILLMPKNPLIAIDSVEKAVKDGEISENRIDASIQRIAKAKQKLIPSSNFSIIDNLGKLAHQSSFNEVNEILKQTTISGGDLPLKSTLEGKNLIVIDDLLNCNFLDRQAPAVTIPQQRGYEIELFDKRNLKLISHDLKPSILQLFIRGNPFRGNAGLSMDTQTIYQDLLSQKLIQGLIIYGSPYVLDWFRPLITKNIPWVFTYGEMFEAQAIACQSLFGLSRNHNLIDVNFL